MAFRQIIIVAIALLSALVAGCTKVSTSAGGPRGPNPWTIHGVLRIGAFEDLDSLNPLISNQGAVSDVAQLIFSGLIDYDDRGNAIPDAALAVPTQTNGGISKDGKTITYRLRRNIQFSDRVPLTSADVKYTWEQIVNPRNNVGVRFPYDQVASIDTPDPHTAVVHLKAPSAPFVAAFMRNGIVGSILPKHLLDRYEDLNRISFNSHPIGSGPFIVERWEPGSLLDLVANPHYWRGQPKLKEIKYRIIPNQNTQLTAVRSHEVDLYHQAPEQQYATLKSISGYRVVTLTVNTYTHMRFNCRRPPLDDARVRRAIAYAIDWKKLVDTVYMGIDMPGMTDQSPRSWAYNPNIKPYPHDPARAKALLAEAGWSPGSDGIMQKNGRKLAISITAVTGATSREKTEQLAQQDLRAVGIELAIRNYPANVMFATYGGNGIISRGRFDIALFSFGNDPDPDDTNTIAPDEMPPNGRNYSFYADPDIGKWLKAARAHYSRDERRPYYWKIQERIHDQVPFHAIMWWTNIATVNADMSGFRPATVVSDFWNSWDWSI